ncbi:MAG: SMI1/KNR4 family protein [Gimesia chilikensis]|uniref:SMI1/KNR4 family protein n=1 Tax=Gimesia chilikensis TaxID=2605989 RepID=UPI0037B6BCC2
MYQEVIRLIERAGVAFPPLGNGVSQDAIENAETVLGFALPKSYKWWLLNYGGGQIQADIVYGLDEDGMGRPDLIELAHMNEQDGLYGRERIVFCMGNAENFVFDTENLDKNGEYAILLHEISGGEEIPYAASFVEFLQRRITEVCRA